jgi:molybdopterin-binding protein
MEVAGDMNPGERVILCIRPENVTLTDPGTGNAMNPRNAFPAKVERITPMGLYHKVKLNSGFSLVAYLTNHSITSLCLKEGGEAIASFKPSSVHAIPEHRKAVI